MASSQISPSASRSAHILAILETAQPGTWLSGEVISVAFGISRAAVAKHVAQLRSQGHAIEAATRRGYRLRVKYEALHQADVEALLTTRCFGKSGWTLLAETTSTSHEAMRCVINNAPEGHIVTAERQSAGRDIAGNIWPSAPRGLQFSLILRPQASHWNAQQVLTRATTSVACAIEAVTGLPVQIKAPNSVLVRTRKVSGILIETGFRGASLEWAILGIGCNVNALPEEFLPAIDGNTTSLFMETQRSTSRAQLMAVMLNMLEENLPDA